MSEPEIIQEMYRALNIDVSMLEIATVIKACKHAGVKNLAFFFSRLTLFEEVMILLTFLKFCGNDVEEYEKLKM